MANKQRAEVEVLGASGTRYVFRLGSGAICRLEDALDLDVTSLFKKLTEGTVRLKTVREFVIASFVEKELSPEEANDLIDDCGVVPLLGAMTDSLVLTFNVQEKKADPPKPARAKRAAGSGSLNGPQKLAS